MLYATSFRICQITTFKNKNLMEGSLNDFKIGKPISRENKIG